MTFSFTYFSTLITLGMGIVLVSFFKRFTLPQKRL